MTSVTQLYVAIDQNSGPRRLIPGGSLAKPVSLVQLLLPAGDFVLNANIDMAPAVPAGQQYTCELTASTLNEPVDTLPFIYGVQTRVTLGGVVHLYSPSQVTVSCGSDSPANMMKARLTALHVDHINPVSYGSGVVY